VHSRELSPMAGGSGDCHHDVICIETDKVFDFCFQEEHVERTFTVPTVDHRMLNVECQIDQAGITYREIGSRREADGRNRFLVCLVIEVPVTLSLVDAQNPDLVVQVIRERVVFLKQAVLCTPTGSNVACEVTGNCSGLFDRQLGQVSCEFDFCVLLKSTAKVRVLVQTLGICVPQRRESVNTDYPPVVPIDEIART
jgi:hypothetical protein